MPRLEHQVQIMSILTTYSNNLISDASNAQVQCLNMYLENRKRNDY